MRHVIAGSFILASLVALGLPFAAQAETVDLSISASSIRFSEDELYSGENVRIYATIKNQGDVDASAQVFFYKSDTLIGVSQHISVLADGGKDDVFVDFILPDGAFNIRAVIQGSNPVDTNPGNDVAVTPLFKTISDDDRDGVDNATDNCKQTSNPDQVDFDQDGKGDECDADIDNDGVLNDDDAFPRDASKSKVVVEPVVEVAPPPVAEVKPVVVTPPEVKPVVKEESVEPVKVSEPVPAVLGEVAEEAIAEPQEVALDLSGLGAGAPINSPAARFTYRQINWRTYEFVAIQPLGGEAYTFAWDFGDGSTSVQTTITHTFSASGDYTVTLGSVDASGQVTSDSEVISVSFFHLSNPLLLLTVGVLVLTLIGLVLLILRLRRGEEV
ncbi:MAG: PKD domain-containing protein [Patescibacteria group bacterium]